MTRSLKILVIMMMCSHLSAQDVLKVYTWKYRIFLLRCENLKDEDYQNQKKAFLEQRDKVTERDLLIIGIESGTYRVDVWTTEETFTIAQAEVITEKYLTKEAQVLIGKDGGVKLRGQQIAREKLFAVIDAMPMRRREMQERDQ